ncbi:MAG: hypothetical protein B6242_16950 [Anaerolineaceae bacterium 4572_78]|nr:MAG: hypothetical protein B6242_16950 [Anaerolineaceae bacterium 4572_78]
MNFLWLLGVLLAVIFITPDNLEQWGISHGPLKFLREYIMLAMAGISFVTAPLSSKMRKENNFTFDPILEVAYLFIGIFIAMAGISFVTAPLSSKMRKENNFTFDPILEVAYLFIGIFIAMIPALEILKAKGAELGVTQPWPLDNAPTYLTFLSMAQGLESTNPTGLPISPELAHLGIPDELLAAISLGAVFMGAMTYIGNGPNFMVKAIADEWGYRTPDFFTYALKYSIPILVPIFIVVTLIYLV